MGEQNIQLWLHSSWCYINTLLQIRFTKGRAHSCKIELWNCWPKPSYFCCNCLHAKLASSSIFFQCPSPYGLKLLQSLPPAASCFILSALASNDPIVVMGLGGFWHTWQARQSSKFSASKDNHKEKLWSGDQQQKLASPRSRIQMLENNNLAKKKK